MVSVLRKVKGAVEEYRTNLQYSGIANKLADLDQRTTLSQVQFCINGKSICNNAGEYFVADFVAVVEKTNNAGKKYLVATIFGKKISKGT
jgi:hypothetical protein